MCSRLRGLFLCLLLCVAAEAQDFRATVSGQVTDPAKAAIVGALVKAIQIDTNETTEAATNTSGNYTLPFLLPGKYTIEVSSPGFKTFRRENVTLLVNDKLNLPVVLELGDVSTTMTVTAETVTVDSADASRGTHFDSTETSEYPLNGRQVYMLMELAPGVLYANEDFGAQGSSGNRGWEATENFVMNGGVKGSNAFTLNGAPVSGGGNFQAVPNLEAVQELKVMLNTYDAQYGRTGGGTVNTTLKSGSNAWHGSLFEFFRHQSLWSDQSPIRSSAGYAAKR